MVAPPMPSVPPTPFLLPYPFAHTTAQHTEETQTWALSRC